MPVTQTAIRHRPRGLVRTDVAISTDASGVASAAIVGVGFGRLVGVLYNGGLDASATVTLKDAKSGASLLTITTGAEGVAVALRPSTAIVNNAGTAVTPDATAPNVNRAIFLAGKVSITVAGGGNLETGTLSLIVDEAGIGDIALTV